MKEPLARSKLVLLSFGLILPILLIATFTLTSTIMNVFNPCMSWGLSSGSVSISQAGTCSSVGSSSETLNEAVLGLVLVQGGIFVGAALSLSGIITERSILILIGSALLFIEIVPLLFDGLFIFSLIPAIFFLSRARTTNVKP